MKEHDFFQLSTGIDKVRCEIRLKNYSKASAGISNLRRAIRSSQMKPTRESDPVRSFVDQEQLRHFEKSTMQLQRELDYQIRIRKHAK